MPESKRFLQINAETENDLRLALKTRPRSADAWFRWGAFCWYKGRMEEARQALHTALLYAPAHAMAHALLGIILRKLGDARQPGDELYKALQAAPGQTFYDLSRRAMHEGFVEIAFAFLEESRRIQEVKLDSILADPVWADVRIHPEFRRITGYSG